MAIPEPSREGVAFNSAVVARGDESRLVVVSNRVPVPSASGSPSAGGLAVALDAALAQRGGLWFGWSGETSADAAARPVACSAFGPVSYAVTDLSRSDVDEYYLGFANRALWPVCHYRLDLAGFSRRDTNGYFRVNEFFARRLASLLRPSDVIWAHDYHFIPLASFLRNMGFRNRIGFFLHIPWPPAEMAAVLPGYDALMRSFAAYDLVGLQTPLDADNFVAGFVRGGHGRPLGGDRIELFGRRLRVGAFPIGIDTPAFRALAEGAESNALVRRTKASLAGRRLIIGVDRLDYSKGLSERIEAFSYFIENNPAARGRVTFLQITPKSRSQVPEYARMQRQVAEQIGSTNGRFGDLDWTPIRYVNKTIGHTALAGLFRAARVGLVTPLRDGMNLVAKEYVAAQPEDDPGVLVLSRFAGAAHELDAALLVNPYDTEATAGALARALAMPPEERRERWAALMERVNENTIDSWCADFLGVLASPEESEPRRLVPRRGGKRRLSPANEVVPPRATADWRLTARA